MSIFSRIFGIQPKSDDKVESGSPETIRVGEFEKELHVLLDRDAYLARSDYKPLCAKYEDLFHQFSTLKKSKTLDYYSTVQIKTQPSFGAFESFYTEIAR